MANELIEREDYPAKAEFHCASYSDASGCNIIVGYDANRNDEWASHIMLNGFEITFPVHAADEVIAAIRYCQTAIKARAKEQP